jgi:hypothetical protein
MAASYQIWYRPCKGRSGKGLTRHAPAALRSSPASITFLAELRLASPASTRAGCPPACFLGANDPDSALKTTLKAEVDPEAWETLHSDTSRPFEKPKSGRIAVKVINHLGDEVMKVFRV